MIVDAHTHLFPPEIAARRDDTGRAEPYFGLLYTNPRRKLWDAPAMLAAMDEAEIDHAVTVNWGWTSLETCRRTNSYLLENAARLPARFSAFVTVPPLAGEAALRELERCAADGARGIGELMPDGQGFRADDALMSAIANQAAVLDLPVLVHSSEPVGHQYPGKGTSTPEKLVLLAEHHPETRFIFAHAGGGLPFYMLMPEIAEAAANIWYDTAAAPLLYRPALYRSIVDLAGVDRLLFASDAPLLRFRRALDHCQEAGLTDTERRAILGGNACQLLGLC